MSARHIRSCLLILLCLTEFTNADTQTESRTMPDPRIEEAIALMNEFAQRTGLTSKQPPRRYLWTDAFAVCNLLGLSFSHKQIMATIHFKQ